MRSLLGPSFGKASHRCGPPIRHTPWRNGHSRAKAAKCCHHVASSACLCFAACQAAPLVADIVHRCLLVVLWRYKRLEDEETTAWSKSLMTLPIEAKPLALGAPSSSCLRELAEPDVFFHALECEGVARCTRSHGWFRHLRLQRVAAEQAMPTARPGRRRASTRGRASWRVCAGSATSIVARRTSSTPASCVGARRRACGLDRLRRRGPRGVFQVFETVRPAGVARPWRPAVRLRLPPLAAGAVTAKGGDRGPRPPLCRPAAGRATRCAIIRPATVVPDFLKKAENGARPASPALMHMLAH